MNHSNVSGRGFPSCVVYNRISFWTRDATGGEDAVVLVHTQGFPTQVLHRQGLTATQQRISSLCTTMKPCETLLCFLAWFLQTHVSIILLKSKTPAMSLAANLHR